MTKLRKRDILQSMANNCHEFNFFSFSSGRMQPSPAFDDAWGQPAGPTPLPRPTHHSTSSVQPSCRAIYDFDADNPAELSFKENDVIFLKSQIDENW